jgi:hypothetical protein
MSGCGLCPLFESFANTHPPPHIDIVAMSKAIIPILARVERPRCLDLKGKSRKNPIVQTPTMLKKFDQRPLKERVRSEKLGTLKSFLSVRVVSDEHRVWRGKKRYGMCRTSLTLQRRGKGLLSTSFHGGHDNSLSIQS